MPSFGLRQSEWLKASAPFIDEVRQDYRVGMQAELQQAISHVRDQCASVLMPILDRARTLAGLDDAVNTDPLSASPFLQGNDATYNNILLAHLARNPRLPAICNEVSASCFPTRAGRGPVSPSTTCAARLSPNRQVSS